MGAFVTLRRPFSIHAATLVAALFAAAPERVDAAPAAAAPFVVSGTFEPGRPDAAVRVGKGATSLATPLTFVRARSVAGSDTLVVGFGTDGVVRVVDLASGSTWTIPDAAPGLIPVMAADGSELLVETDGGLARFDTGGRLTEKMTVPEPTPGELLIDGKQPKLLRSPHAAVRALLRGKDAWYVVAENDVNAVLVAADGSRRIDLPGYGHVLCAVMLDGDVAVIAAWNPSTTPVGIDLVRVDVASGKAGQAVSTGYLVNQGTLKLNGAELVAQGDQVLLYLPTIDYGGADLEALPAQLKAGLHPLPVRSVLYRATSDAGGTLEVAPVKGIADDVGLHLTKAADGSLYFFGGIAGERVTRLSLSADGSALTGEAAELRAPTNEMVLVVK